MEGDAAKTAAEQARTPNRPKPSSALYKRPQPKVVEADDGTSSYVAGVKITDTLAERKNRFSGWEMLWQKGNLSTDRIFRE